MKLWELTVVVFTLWVLAWTYYSIVDGQTCAAAGVPFGGESLSLEGFCMYGTIRVPVEAYRE